MSIREMLLCKLLSIRVMNKAKRRYGSGKKTQAALHSFRRGERQFTLLEHLLQRVDRQFLMALENHQIVAVSLMIPEEEVLAVNRIDVLPVLKRELYCRKRRMSVKSVAY